MGYNVAKSKRSSHVTRVTTDPQGQQSTTEETGQYESESARNARNKSGGGPSLNPDQVSISAAFALVLVGIVAKRHWLQNFLQWIRK